MIELHTTMVEVSTIPSLITTHSQAAVNAVITICSFILYSARVVVLLVGTYVCRFFSQKYRNERVG